MNIPSLYLLNLKHDAEASGTITLDSIERLILANKALSQILSPDIY